MKSDCYALGMLIHEVLSGQVPFAMDDQIMVIRRLLQGERPERPQGNAGKLFTDEIWETLQLCWKEQPSDRLDADGILTHLERCPPLLSPPLLAPIDAGTGADGQSDASGTGMFCSFYPRMIVTYLQNIVDLFDAAHAKEQLNAQRSGMICLFYPRMIVTYVQNIVGLFDVALAQQLNALAKERLNVLRSGMICLFYPRMIVTYLQNIAGFFDVALAQQLNALAKERLNALRTGMLFSFRPRMMVTYLQNLVGTLDTAIRQWVPRATSTTHSSSQRTRASDAAVQRPASGFTNS